jgi:hypothetical protein
VAGRVSVGEGNGGVEGGEGRHGRRAVGGRRPTTMTTWGAPAVEGGALSKEGAIC